MRIVSWNINGIRAAHRKGFLDWLRREEESIVCVQETKIDEATLTLEMRAALGKHTVWAFAKRKGYSGVAIFSKREPLRTRVGIGIDRFDDEGRVVEMEFEKFRLFNVYFPKGSGTLRDNSRVPYKLEFYAAFFDYVLKRRKPAIVVGDFNTAHQPIDLKNAKTNTKNSGFLLEERMAFEKHLRRGFIDTYRFKYPDRIQYSWWMQAFNARERNVGWRIDYVWMHEKLAPFLREAFIDTHVLGSDHCPVGVELAL